MSISEVVRLRREWRDTFYTTRSVTHSFITNTYQNIEEFVVSVKLTLVLNT